MLPTPISSRLLLRALAMKPGDRLQSFRVLCLLFAILTLAGVIVAVSLTPAATQVRTIAGAVVLASVWVWGYRRGSYGVLSAPVEAALLLLVIHGLPVPFQARGICYIAIQYRALYGSRRDAALMGAAYLGAYMVALQLVPEFGGVMRPIVVVEVMALAFCVFLMHTLAEALRRDHEGGRALRESEQRFRSVAENLREALLITDAEDRIILANSRVREVLGYGPDEVIGRNATDLLLPESQRNVFRDRLTRRLNGETELYETELIRKDGQRITAEVSASPYRDLLGNIVGTLGAISDISDRKRLEERLRQGLRMEAVGQLAGGVAHDFNNLLTVIKCHTELLHAELPDDAARDSVLEIERSADRAATLTRQLLAFSRRQMLQPRRVSLAQAVAESAPMLQGLVRESVTVRTRHDDSPTEVFADPLQIEHMLVALVDNSNDAMPLGGRITIETRTVEHSTEWPMMSTQEMPPGGYAELRVSDSGVGMERDVVARLFEPFFTTKQPGEGTGLGLASVYGWVRQSGGYLDVESSRGNGTVFRIYLPLADRGMPTTAVRMQPA